MINARRARNRIAQTTAFWLFRFATYAILAAATYIFLDIGIKGSRTLFTTQAPFINVPFFTQGPQTLFVFDYEGKKYTLSDREFRAWNEARLATMLRRFMTRCLPSAEMCQTCFG